ncbi:MAG: helix-turn-helix domain-containing protein [Candidatus Brockarchaeota archaeon]|nr:helix-turn-helix domain-containing protein [Candidatus Brockarchaeota archaeon]
MSHDSFDEAEAVFEAAASPVRLRILRTLEANSSKYNELMRQIGLDQFKDAGRFAYHLRKLLQNGLVDIDPNTKKYRLTELGARIFDQYRSLGDYLSRKTKRMEVRKSDLTMVPFDRVEIENYLIKEASLRPDIAAQIATEVEERIFSVPVKYLTAPLIREFVNAVLIEKGHEEYRHKLTRLGLPVYDVTSIFETSGQVSENVKRQAGDSVLEQYVRLNAVPREVADAHLSGMIHLNHEADWCLKPEDVVHDASALVEGKKVPSGWGAAPIALEFSGGVEDALRLLGLGLEKAADEVGCGQTLDCFNFTVAKWAKGCEWSVLKKAINDFLFGAVTLEKPLAMTLDLGSPPIQELREHSERASSIAELIVSQLLSLSKHSLLGNLKLIVRMGGEGESAEESTLALAHTLSLEQGNVVFTNKAEGEGPAAYTWNCARISSKRDGDYAAEVSRSGIVGSVAVNLPRIARQTSGNERKLFENLDKALRLATKALEVKRDWIANDMAKGFLPVLSHRTPAESYFNHAKGVYLVELVGIDEVESSFLGESAEGSFPITKKILEHLLALLRHRTERSNIRLALSAGRHHAAAARMARVDGESFGRGKSPEEAGRAYSTHQLTRGSLPLDSRLPLEAEFQRKLNGGHVFVVGRDALENAGAEEALQLTRKAFEEFRIQSITYSVKKTMCLYCGSVMESGSARCGNCGSTTRFYMHTPE